MKIKFKNLNPEEYLLPLLRDPEFCETFDDDGDVVYVTQSNAALEMKGAYDNKLDLKTFWGLASTNSRIILAHYMLRGREFSKLLTTLLLNALQIYSVNKAPYKKGALIPEISRSYRLIAGHAGHLSKTTMHRAILLFSEMLDGNPAAPISQVCIAFKEVFLIPGDAILTHAHMEAFLKLCFCKIFSVRLSHKEVNVLLWKTLMPAIKMSPSTVPSDKFIKDFIEIV